MEPFSRLSELYRTDSRRRAGKLLKIGVEQELWSIGVTSITEVTKYMHRDSTDVLPLRSTEGEWVYVLEGNITFHDVGRANCRRGHILYLPEGTKLEYTVHSPVLACSLWESAFESSPALWAHNESAVLEWIRRIIENKMPGLISRQEIMSSFSSLFWANGS